MLAEVGHAAAARLGRDSAAAALLGPVYSWCLGKACGRRGLAWRVNGEPMRIDPAVRHLLPHENEPELFAFLRDQMRVVFAGGQDHLKGKIIRIAHLGYMDVFDIISAIAAFEMALRHFGHPVELGRGVGAAENELLAALPA